MEVTTRRCSKVLLVDEQQRVLLFSGIDRTKPELCPWWFAGGGQLDSGETHAQAAVRETFEETGLVIDDPGSVVFTRSFRWEFEGRTFDQEERFYFIRMDRDRGSHHPGDAVVVDRAAPLHRRGGLSR